MKYNKILLFVLLSYISINASYSIECRIDFNINGLENKKIVFAYEYGYKQIVVDTIRLDKEGKGFYSPKNRLNGGIYLLIFPDKNKYFELLINNEQFFTIYSDTSDLFNKLIIEGSDESELFRQYQVMIKEYEKFERNKIGIKEYSDTVGRQPDLLKKINDFTLSVLKEKPQSFLAAYFKMKKEPDIPKEIINKSPELNRNMFIKRYIYLKNHYFDNISFTDNRLLHTKLICEKLDYYFNRFISQDTDSLTNAIDYVTNISKVSDESYRFVLNFLNFNYRNPKNTAQESAFVYLADNYYLNGKAKWADPKFLKLLKIKTDAMRPSLVGSIINDFELQTPEEKTITLYSVKADYICLYFWSPDCNLCKSGAMELNNVYNKYKSKGLKVVAIYVHADKTLWKNFLDKYNFNWVNVYDPLLKNNFVKTYNLEVIPKLFLLDKNKKIIAKNISASQIESYIKP